MLHKFRYSSPGTRQELLAQLAEEPERSKLLAGGTDLLVNIRGGLTKPQTVTPFSTLAGLSSGYRDGFC